jgi:hypothetical protein
MERKETVLAICLPVSLACIGLVPWFCEKRGVVVPDWAVSVGEALTVISFGALLFFLLDWILKKITSKTIPLGGAVSFTVSSCASIATLMWLLNAGQLEVIYGRSYRNEEVTVDGKKFDHCNFENITFFYHGTAPWAFIESKFITSPNTKYYLRTDNDSIKGYTDLTEFLSDMPGMKERFRGTIDDKGNILPISPPQYSDK